MVDAVGTQQQNQTDTAAQEPFDRNALRAEVERVKSELEGLARRQALLQDALKEIDKSEATLATERDAAQTQLDDAQANLDVLDEEYKNDPYKPRVEKAFSDFKTRLTTDKTNLDGLEATVLDKTRDHTAQVAVVERRKADFQKAKTRLADLTNKIKGQTAKVKGLVADANAAWKAGKDVEALILISQLKDEMSTLKTWIGTAHQQSLWVELDTAQDSYDEAAQTAQTLQEAVQIKTAQRDDARKAYDELVKPANSRKEIKQLVDAATEPPPGGNGSAAARSTRQTGTEEEDSPEFLELGGE